MGLEHFLHLQLFKINRFGYFVIYFECVFLMFGGLFLLSFHKSLKTNESVFGC